MSSSGLIYAVIVGAWAAYLVPMWLRRQDELNEARPTERFSTAIRLLSGRAAMERRLARATENSTPEAGGGTFRDAPAHSPAPTADSLADRSGDITGFSSSVSAAEAVDVRALAVPVKAKPPKPRPSSAARPPAPTAVNRRAQVLARRRRTTTVLFLAFTTGAIAAGVGGTAFLWAPAIPGALLTAYIGYLRRQERRRFTARLQRRRTSPPAARRTAPPPAAQPARRAPSRAPGTSSSPGSSAPKDVPAPAPGESPGTPPVPAVERPASHRAVVEQTDHAEWVDGLNRRPGTDQDGWDPVPVPLPTYVTAPVAPRVTENGESHDEGASAAWSPATSSATPPGDDTAQQHSRGRARRARERGGTPLFDQHDSGGRPRAANE